MPKFNPQADLPIVLRKHNQQRPWQRLLCAALLALSLPAHAATFIVNNGSDATDAVPGDGQCNIGNSSCTLRAAIQEANFRPGDDIIQLHVATVNLSRGGRNEDQANSGDLDIRSNMTIQGALADNTTISAYSLDRVFDIMNNARVTLVKVNVVGGEVDGSVGGGIRIQDKSVVTISASEISSNRAASTQDADCNVGTIDLMPCALTEVATGGGIYIGAEATLNISNTIIRENTGKTAAGGIDNHGRTIVRSNSVIATNITSGTGGGIRNFGGFFSIAQSVINNNSAAVGGGVYNSTADQNLGSMLMSNVDVHTNSASQIGGGIFNAGPMTINHTSIRDNGNPFDGGGIYNLALGNIDMYNSTISGNRASRNGGGILTSRLVNLTNVTLYANTAAAAGASTELNVGGNQIALLDSELLNTENNPGVNIVNTIIANGPGNTQPTCAGLAGYASTLVSLGNNIETADDCNLSLGSDQTFTNPRLDVITNQGPVGVFSDTYFHPLLSASPAINAGNATYCPMVDQRFMLRNVGACDVGAFEFGATERRNSNLVDLSLIVRDNPDPVAPNNDTQLLTYSFTVVNNYDAVALDTNLQIILPSSVNYEFYTDDGINTGISCSPPNSINTMNCDLRDMLGLNGTQVFVTVRPTAEGIITVRAEVDSAVEDAFLPNNSDAEDTTVTKSASSNITNFGGGGGGGGALAPITLLSLLGGAWLLRRRKPRQY